MREILNAQADRIEQTLFSHGVPARVYGGVATPRLAQYHLTLGPGVKLSRVAALADDLALALGAPQCRIQRHGAALSVEVPRGTAAAAGSDLFALARDLPPPPPFAALLGRGESGAPLLLRLSSPEIAHVLIAGTTGSGKTELARTMIAGLARFNPPERLRLLLVDPKGRAFRDFAGLPHLVCPVVVDTEEAVERLKGLVAEMERRDRSLRLPSPVAAGEGEAGDPHWDWEGAVGEIAGPGKEETRGLPGRGEVSALPWPRIVLFVDEMADLMLSSGRAVEGALTRLVQRGREAGIHVVACTQRPAAVVIGGMVKANFPCRLVGRVASPEDAKVATGIRGSGAERLQGRGDFLLVACGQVRRVQVVRAGAAGIQSLVPAAAVPGLSRRPLTAGGASAASPRTPAGDPSLLTQVKSFLRVVK